jgi:pimeloyl-ACP methyl ester carboxylesterase
MIVDAIPGATMHLVEGVGHCVHMEAGAAVNELVRQFIEAHA